MNFVDAEAICREDEIAKEGRQSRERHVEKEFPFSTPLLPIIPNLSEEENITKTNGNETSVTSGRRCSSRMSLAFSCITRHQMFKMMDLAARYIPQRLIITYTRSKSEWYMINYRLLTVKHDSFPG